MAQMWFAKNIPTMPPESAVIAGSSMRFFPMEFPDSISLNTVNIAAVNGVGAANITYRFGLYSLNASTALSLANSWSITFSIPNGANSDMEYRSMSSFSSTQNISPGTWWIGMLESKGAANGMNCLGAFNSAPANAPPGAFVMGIHTVTSASPPTSVATSDISQTASTAMFSPMLIISA